MRLFRLMAGGLFDHVRCLDTYMCWRLDQEVSDSQLTDRMVRCTICHCDWLKFCMGTLLLITQTIWHSSKIHSQMISKVDLMDLIGIFCSFTVLEVPAWADTCHTRFQRTNRMSPRCMPGSVKHTHSDFKWTITVPLHNDTIKFSTKGPVGLKQI